MGAFAITNNDLQRILPVLRHSFLEGLNQDNAKLDSLYNLLVEDVPFGQDTIELKDLGSIGDWYEWTGEAQSETFNLFTGAQSIKEWHIEIPLNMRDLAFDAGPVLERKAQAAGERHRSFQIRRLIQTHLDSDASSGSTANAARVLGGTKFFRATGDSGHFGQSANVNALTYNAASTSAMTAAEWQAVHNAVVTAILGFKDDKGVLLNPLLDVITYIASPGHAPGFVEAFQAPLASGGGTNPYIIGSGELGSARLITTPMVTAANVYAVNTSPGVPKPFFLLRPLAEEDYILLDVDVEKKRRVVTTFGHAMWQFGFQNQLSAVKMVLT